MAGHCMKRLKKEEFKQTDVSASLAWNNLSFRHSDEQLEAAHLILLGKEKISLSEAYSTAYTPIRDDNSPHHMDHDSVVSPSRYKNDSIGSLETLCVNELYLADRLDPMVLDVAEAEQGNNWPSNEEREILDEHMPITVDRTPHSKFPDTAALELMAVQTPATKECTKVLKKRKCLFDVPVLVPTNDTGFEGKLTPLTIFQIVGFWEPLIPGMSLDLRSFQCEKILQTEPIEAVELPTNKDGVGSPVTQGGH
ncbi:putative sister chromatid cohesion 1 protein 2 [Abeliophyllum distichum]|uniref:Sister chromatid cohesion 1 protein 2 n=1 Tax=Abeliophyllum distichum TaxID=126358 RepID=A0ABD1SKD0_9LAMI